MEGISEKFTLIFDLLSTWGVIELQGEKPIALYDQITLEFPTYPEVLEVNKRERDANINYDSSPELGQVWYESLVEVEFFLDKLEADPLSNSFNKIAFWVEFEADNKISSVF